MSNNDEEPAMTGKSESKPDGTEKQPSDRKFRLKRMATNGKSKLKTEKCDPSLQSNIDTLWEKDLECTNKSHTFKPLVNDDYILINADGFTVKFDLDGKKIFSTKTGALNHIRPAIDRNENIYVIAKDELISLYPSGKIKWKTKAGEISHTPFIDDDGMIYLAARDSHALALNPEGTIYWRKKINELESSQPYVDSNGFLHLKLFEGSHIIINRKRGFFNPTVVKEIRGKSTKPVTCGPDGRIYHTNSNHNGNEFTCMTVEGKVLWKYKLPVDTKTVLIREITNDRVLVAVRTDTIMNNSGDDDEREDHRHKKTFLLVLDNNGKEIFKFYADGEEKFDRHISISHQGNIYLTNNQAPGKLYAISERGDLLWKRLFEDAISRPRIGPQGKIILTGGKNTSLKAFSHVDGKFLGEKTMQLAHGQSYQLTENGDIIAVDRNGKMSKLRFSEVCLSTI